jgi:CHAT domain-containing protein
MEVAAACSRADQRTIERALFIAYAGTDLPATQQELNDAGAVYGSRVTVLDGNSLTKSDILAALTENYDLIHFCGHGDFDYLEPMQSRIYFQSSDRHDGSITAADTINCGTIGRRPVVVLSACTGAAVLPNGANNFLGLAGALIRTGVTAIVGARWPVSDQTCAAFSKVFHQELTDGRLVELTRQQRLQRTL